MMIYIWCIFGWLAVIIRTIKEKQKLRDNNYLKIFFIFFVISFSGMIGFGWVLYKYYIKPIIKKKVDKEEKL